MIVVTLVHGTWGRGMLRATGDAPWTRDDSSLARAISARFGDEATLRRFRWSGGNTHSARRRAAAELRADLIEALDGAPRDSHVVVAHSHGGNVALMAIDTPELGERIAGIACLATPFICARERDLGPNPTAVFAAAVTALGFVLLGLAGRAMPATWSELARGALRGAIMVALGAAFVVALRGALGFSRRLLDELTPTLPSRERLLIVRSPADEASSGLAVFQILSQISVRVFFAGQAAYVRLERLANRWAERTWRVAGFGLAALVVFVGALLAFREVAHGTARSWLGGSFLALAVVGFLGFAVALYLILPFLGPKGAAMPIRLVVSALLWPTMIAVSLLMLFPFGWQAAVANLLLDVTTESTPVGDWDVHLVEPTPSAALGATVPVLMHGVYENPRAHARVVSWIAERAAKVAEASAGRP